MASRLKKRVPLTVFGQLGGTGNGWAVEIKSGATLPDPDWTQPILSSSRYTIDHAGRLMQDAMARHKDAWGLELLFDATTPIQFSNNLTLTSTAYRRYLSKWGLF